MNSLLCKNIYDLLLINFSICLGDISNILAILSIETFFSNKAKIRASFYTSSFLSISLVVLIAFLAIFFSSFLICSITLISGDILKVFL